VTNSKAGENYRVTPRDVKTQKPWMKRGNDVTIMHSYRGERGPF